MILAPAMEAIHRARRSVKRIKGAWAAEQHKTRDAHFAAGGFSRLALAWGSAQTDESLRADYAQWL